MSAIREKVDELSRRERSRTTSRASSRALSAISAGSRRSSRMQGATQPSSMVGQKPVVRSRDPGTSSTGGLPTLPTLTSAPPISWGTTGVPLSVPASIPVSVTQNAQSFVPFTAQTHVSAHQPPVVTSCVSQPMPVSSYAIHAQVHVPSSIYTPAQVSMPVTTHFTHPTQSAPALFSVPVTSMHPRASVFQPVHSQSSAPTQPGLPASALHALLPFTILFQLRGTFCPDQELGPRLKIIGNCPGSSPNLMAKKDYLNWRLLFITVVHCVEVSVDQKVQVMIASLSQESGPLRTVKARLCSQDDYEGYRQAIHLLEELYGGNPRL